MSTVKQDMLQCSNCTKDYDLGSRRPKFLVCHHSMCMQCIESLITTNRSNKTVACPTCSKITCIGRQGVAALFDNVYLMPKPLEEKPPIKHEDRNSEIFYSDSEGEDGFFDEAVGGTKTNGFDANRMKSNVTAKVRIFCQTCLTIATSQCITDHVICNYKQGVQILQNSLHKTTQCAGEALTNEIEALEKVCDLLYRTQSAWSCISHILDNTLTSHITALSFARSSLESLPDVMFGFSDVLKGNPVPLAKAVKEVENIAKTTSVRLKNTQQNNTIWKAVSNCCLDLQTAVPLPLNENGTSFSMEYSNGTKGEYLCMMYLLTKMLETRLTPLDESAVESTNSKSKNIPKKKMDTVNGHSPQDLSNNSVKQPCIVVTKPLTTGYIYCYFNLTQGCVNLGKVVFELNFKIAPKMSKNFMELCTGKYGFGYLHTKIWKSSSQEHVDGGDLPEGGNISIYDGKPFTGDDSKIHDNIGMLRMRGRGTQSDGRALVGSQFMVWTQQRNFKSFPRTLVFGQVKEGLDILINLPEYKFKKGYYIPPITINDCGTI